MTIFVWILTVTVGWLLVTGIAGRLLGATRGWVALSLAGVGGLAAGVIAAGELADWDWESIDMVAVALGLGVLFTMTLALAFDLAAPVGSLAQGQPAGLVTIRNPVRAARGELAPSRRSCEVLAIAGREGVLSRSVTHDQLPTGVRRTLESAGGIFVKLGQVASTRADVLPPAWCDELALEFVESVEEELDFTREVRNGLELANGLAVIDGIRRHRTAVLELLAAASAGDAVALRQALERIARFDRSVDSRTLDVALEEFLARNMTSGSGITATAFQDLALLIGEFGIRPRVGSARSAARWCRSRVS